MHPHITRLAELAAKPQRRIVGLMSGTSLDGLDIAVCQISGAGADIKLVLEFFETLDYSDDFRARVRQVFARERVELATLCSLNAEIGSLHGDMVATQLSKWRLNPQDIDLVASHGQTVFHHPKSLHHNPELPNSTLQIGDGDHIACSTGIITLSDFRQKHIAAGGEGAPLVAYGDRLLFTDTTRDRLLLNIGGIANFTLLKAGGTDTPLCADVGPGNTLMDAYVQRETGSPFDVDGALAAKGEVNAALLESLLSDDYFSLPLPKTTGPETFNLDYLESHLAEAGAKSLAPEDVLATLCAFSAQAIAEAINKLPCEMGSLEVFVSGGGSHNPTLMAMLRSYLGGVSIQSTDALGVDPDAKEAMLFAILANETVAGKTNSSHSADEGIPNITMGKVSFPD